MVLHVIDALAELDIDRVVVVVGHGSDQVIKTVTELAPGGLEVVFAEQPSQRGTGDAASVGLGALRAGADDDEDVVVLPGDTPLLKATTLAELVRMHRSLEAGVTLLTAEAQDPTGYGRIVRSKDGRVAGVVEQADVTGDQASITEVNTSIYCFRRSVLGPALRRLSPQNAQGELYLTDVVAVLHDAGFATHSLTVADPMEAAGVNDRAQLAVAEAELRDRVNERWMRRGVTMWDPERTYVDVTVDLAEDVTLLPGTVLRGACRVGSGARIGPNAFLEDTVVAEGAVVETVRGIRSAVGVDAIVESYSILEPGSVVAAGDRIAPFTTLHG
jgi:bifunctional UDP-N-acetylglucosamine pyrophosphorylase/glucosamine-1-phosphate N-acetyltransferase